MGRGILSQRLQNRTITQRDSMSQNDDNSYYSLKMGGTKKFYKDRAIFGKEYENETVS